MGKYGDWLIMIAAGCIIVLWLYRMFYRWLHEPPGVNSRLLLSQAEAVDEEDENVQFLERNGYEVLYGKYRIPITIRADDEELHSRLFIDMIAERNGEYYVVKTARDRMPVEWTGSGLRDRLMVYALLMPECEGVLFVDQKANMIRKVTFQMTD